jgi:hypothetical protein
MVPCRPYLGGQRPDGSIQILDGQRPGVSVQIDGRRPYGSCRKYPEAVTRSVFLKLEIYCNENLWKCISNIEKIYYLHDVSSLFGIIYIYTLLHSTHAVMCVHLSD